MVSPRECTEVTDQEREELAQHEKAIDQALRMKFRPGSAVTYGVEMSARVRDEVIRRYRETGWTVEAISDQRDGNFLSFTAARRDGAQ